MAPSGNKEADVATVTATINARLESRVRMHPTQWLWLHDRWKSSPGVFDAG
jgi:KDO2-lipid IV(A) lauroyltransferase